LVSQVQVLTTQNDELTIANTQLKKENRDLKNIVDQIKLRLARDTKALLQYENSELRKAVIRLFRWTLG
jgi:FtsZ-binding cell division protein ZapB